MSLPPTCPKCDLPLRADTAPGKGYVCANPACVLHDVPNAEAARVQALVNEVAYQKDRLDWLIDIVQGITFNGYEELSHPPPRKYP